MNWTKLIYILIIVLLYVPMVFVGANVFFPKYTGTNAYFHSPYMDNCYQKYPFPEKTTETQSEEITQKQQQCQEQLQQKQEAWENEKLAYEGTKYIFITLFNLFILLIVLFLKTLQDSVTMGLFLGSITATFGATIRYFDTRSKIGFILLVITFFITLYFINRKKDSFIDWKEKK